MANFCSRCGAPLDASGRCPRCQPMQPVMPGSAPARARKKDNSWLAIPLVLLVLVLCGFAVFRFGLQPRRLVQELQLGEQYLTQLDYDAAITSFTRAIKIDPKSEDAFMSRAAAYAWQGETRRAISDYTTVIKEINPNNADAYLGRAAQYELLGETDKARADRRKAESLGGGSSRGTRGFFLHEDLPDGTVEHNGHYYYLFDADDVYGGDGATYCESRRGYLAAVTSQDENDFLQKYVSESGYQNVYIGLTDGITAGSWTWVNGENSNYTNWAGAAPAAGTETQYAEYSTGAEPGKWVVQGQNSGRTAYLCEWGTYTVDDATAGEADIVMVLDCSGSMDGYPMEQTQAAADRFTDTILQKDARIGLVGYTETASQLCGFTRESATIHGAVDELDAGGGTNIEAGLAAGARMLNASTAKKRILVLMSDGDPNNGLQGDSLIQYADTIREDGIRIYTVGFFGDGGGNSYAQSLMEGIASSGCHYEVSAADDLQDFFNDIADQINGQRYMYLRVACPVDVSVRYNGEELNSAEDSLQTRTEFGTLSFEDGEDENDRVKVLRLKEGADYDVSIVGTGRGFMEYTIGFSDENGNYTDFRTFENIRIRKGTQIETTAAQKSETELRVDEDGDGSFEKRYRAEANAVGEEIRIEPLLYLVCGIGGLLVLLVLIVTFRILHKTKRKVNKNHG